VSTEVVQDQPVRTLLSHTDTAQLIVVGNRGRGGFTSMLLGSTSTALLYSARCPLLIARGPR
ncbi:MAG: universal stress protein, partial [Mycobacteriaceae bacterium]